MGFGALDRLYETQDEKFICICCRDDTRFAALMQSIGEADLVEDPRFATAAARSAHDSEIKKTIAPFFMARTAQEALVLLKAGGVAAELAREPGETSWVDEILLADWALRTDRVIEHLDARFGHIREFAFMTELGRRYAVRKPSAPLLGQHNAEVLAEIGYSPERIAQFVV